MGKLKFDIDWEDPAGARGEELRATWAKLSISYVSEKEQLFITEILDKGSETVKDHIYLPLYPLAEWLVINWWFLHYEPFTPTKFKEGEYEKRHCLIHAQDGYSLPNLRIQPAGNTVILNWKPIDIYNHGIRFLSSNERTISLESFTQSITEFISKIVQRLLDSKPSIADTYLQKEWAALQKSNADQDEFDFCKVTASIGLDPYTVVDNKAEALIKIFESLPAGIVDDFFPACHFNNIKKEANATLDAINIIKKDKSDIPSLRKIKDKLSKNSSSAPWSDGYYAARQLRKVLNLNGKPIVSVKDMESAFKLSDRKFNERIQYLPSLPSTISAISGNNINDTPTIIVSKRFNDEAMEKFTLCRAFYEYFFSDPQDCHLITKTYLTSQKKNRAFAAEFLVPADTLRKEIPSHFITEDDIEYIAGKYKVSTLTIEHQIVNHRIAKIERSYC